MSRRAREWEAAREAKRAEAFEQIDDDPDLPETGDDGPTYSCPGCCKARGEPFHCTVCGCWAEGPGYAD